MPLTTRLPHQSTTARLCESSEHTSLTSPRPHVKYPLLQTWMRIFHFNWFSSSTKVSGACHRSEENKSPSLFLAESFRLFFFLSHFFKKIEDICFFVDKFLFPQAALWCFGAFHLVDICYCCMCVFISASSATWGAIECWTTRSALSS